MPKQIKTKAELDEATTKGPVVLDCFAEWCGPCKMIAPQFETWEGEYAKVSFLKLDVDEAEDLAEELGVSAMPVLFFFKDGQVVETVTGTSVEAIKKKLEIISA